MNAIARILAREVLDSRGDPTVEAEVHTRAGPWGRAIVPSGASTGAAEAHELRDGDSSRYGGRGVTRAVAHIREIIAPALGGMDVTDQQAVDAKLLDLDGTPNKSLLGANAILAVSLAAAHAGAAVRGVPLYRHLNDLAKQVDASAPAPRMPLPMVNMISGGLHAGGNLDFQDFMVISNGARDLKTSLQWSVAIYRCLGQLLARSGFEGRLVGDEGGYGPRLPSNSSAAEFVTGAIAAAGLQAGRDASLALDVASSRFYQGGQYHLTSGGEVRLTSDQMIDQLADLIERFPIVSIEDALAEEDWDGWRKLTARLGPRIRLVGDDLFATNVDRLRHGIELGAANCVLIKVNQIGTLTETLEAVALARRAGYSHIVSARSGETEDSTIADLAVATAAEAIKIGSIVRSERLAKYNQLLRIAEQLEPAALP